MSEIIAACLLAVPGLPVETLAPPAMALAAAGGTMLAANRRTLRKALRKSAWQQLWHRQRKLDIESPEFIWVAVILGGVALFAFLAGLAFLGWVTLAAAVLALLRSFV
jgi:hypothetical protein